MPPSPASKAPAGTTLPSGPASGLAPGSAPGLGLQGYGVAAALVALAATFIALNGIKELSQIIAPLFLVINLFIAAWPIRSWLTKMGAPKPISTLALGAVVLLVIFAFFFSLGWALSELVAEIPQYEDQFNNLYNNSVAWLTSIGVTEEVILDQLKTISPSNLTGVLQTLLTSLSGAVTLLSVLLVLIVMMTLDSASFDKRSAALKRHPSTVSLALSDFITGVRNYWVVSTIFGLIVAAIDVGILLATGVPLAIVWGIVAFVTNYIPNVGFIIGTIPAVLMALLDEGPGVALLVAVLYIVVNFVIQSLIQPKFNGDAVGITATVSFLSLLLWSYALGPIGALIGVPATLLVKNLLIDHNPQLRWLNAFISSKGDDSDPREVLVSIHGEAVALYGDDGKPTGATAMRREVREKNLRHGATAIVLSNTAGQVFVHRRTQTKDVYPGLYDLAAGGVIVAGEEPKESAARELLEELGVDAPLTPVAEGSYADSQTNYAAFLYTAQWDGMPTLQAAEVASGQWMTPEEIREAVDTKALTFVPDSLALWAPHWKQLTGQPLAQ